MPNWCYNRMLIDKKDMEKFNKIAVSQGEVDFEILLPHPLAVQIDEYYGSFITNKHEIDLGFLNTPYNKIPFDWFVENAGEKALLQTIFSFDDSQGWYLWNIEHWGTKWNAGETSITDTDDDGVLIEFDTAWSAPMPWFMELAKHIPFDVECEEEGGFFHYNCVSDGKGNLSVDDDTEEFFKTTEEDE